MKKIIPFVIVLALVVSLAACDNTDPTPSASPSPSGDIASVEPSVEPVSTEPSTEPSVEPSTEPSDEPAAVPVPADFTVESGSVVGHDGNMSVFYPVFASDGHGDAAASVNDYFHARALDAVAGFESYLTDYEQGANPFTLDYTYSVEYAHRSVASVLVSIEEYYGGAHEGLTYMAYTVSLEGSGSLLGVADMFAADAETVREVALAEVRAQIADREHLYDDADVAAGELLDLSERAYLSDDGLVVFYQNYDLGPYVAGPQFFTIPYDILPLADEYSVYGE